MESWYTKLFSMTLVKVKMHLEGLNGWNEIVKPKKLKVIVWQRKLESHLTFFSKPNKTCNYQYCKWWLYIISNQPQQPAVQINLILATHFGDGTDLRRSPLGRAHRMWWGSPVSTALSKMSIWRICCWEKITRWVAEVSRIKGPNSNLEFPELRHCRVGKPDTREGTFQCCSPCHNGQTPVLVWKKVSPYIFHPGCINIGTFFSGICRTLGESWISSCSPEN